MDKLIGLCLILTWIKSTVSTEYFDLSYVLDESNIFYPGQRFGYELYKDVGGYSEAIPEHLRYWLAYYSFCMGEHGGTHVDAPFHFNENGWKLGEIPLDRLVNVPAALIDVEKDAFALEDPSQFQLKVSHILEHERRFGTIPSKAVILVHTGWGFRYWPNKEKYLGMKNGTLHFPGLSGNAAKWLVKYRNIVGVGIDTASADVGNAIDLEGAPLAHIALCADQAFIIENVAYLTDLVRKLRAPFGPYTGAVAGTGVTTVEAGIGSSTDLCNLHVIVMPIKSRGTGGPARVLAYCKKY